jgi:hypothetical protein
VNPEITIKITVAPEGVKVSAGEQALTAAGPAPLPLEQLQAGAFAAAPSPVAPEILQTVGVASGPPPAPMALETLQAYAVPEAPTPVAFGELESMAAPRPTLDHLAAATGSPEPMPIEQLTASQGESKSKRR